MTKPHLTPRPERLSATAMRAAMAAGKLDSETVVRACLERIADRERDVRAWTHVDRREALGRAGAFDRLARNQPLHGIPIGIKDLIDTASMPTTYGSPIYAGHRPKADAACVRKLVAAGAVPLGKTVTTEFAYFTPGPTHNPHQRGHTPGGSSSGSAAAVADYQVPVAFGTQTAGSVIRPAAFCGVVGYKGTHGWADMTGIKPLSPFLDTLGVFCREVADLDLVRRAFTGNPVIGLGDPNRRPPRVALCRTPWWAEADADTHALFERVADRLLAAGTQIGFFETGEEWEGLNEAQLAIMAREASRALAKERTESSGQLSERLRQLLEDGDGVGIREETAAKALATKCRNRLAQAWRDFDVILTPAAPGAAPRGIERTGDPVFNRAWTLLGAPCISLPAGKADNGLPLAVQLVGPHNEDNALIAHASWIEAALA